MIDQEFSVFISNSNKKFRCDDSKSLLQSLMLHAVKKDIPIGCRSGGCGVCKVKITKGKYCLKGKMSRSYVSIEEESKGEVLACRVYPRSDLTLSVIGKIKQKVFKV